MTRLDTAKGMANAADAAPSLSPFGPSLFHVSALRASIDFRAGPAAEWLEQAGPIARQLNEESEHDGD